MSFDERTRIPMKKLITGGCSFTEWPQNTHTWPKFLLEHLPEYTHANAALGSSGNGLISRRVIYETTQALKQCDAKDILVGVMWSGPDRHEFYTQRVTDDMTANTKINPCKFIPDSPGAWAIMNGGWKMNHAKIYYTEFHTLAGSLISTLEHILRVQWFLKQHGVRYFMTTYTGDVIPNYVKTFADTEHLYSEIDFVNFLPVSSEYEWCRDHSGIEFPAPNDYHPSGAQHKLFVEQVIIPFLKERNLA